jgi:hypothetical protein
MTEVMEKSNMVAVVNIGLRTFHLQKGPDGKPRLLKPKHGMELTETEAKSLLGFHDIKRADDIIKIAGVAEIKAELVEKDRRIADLEKELAAHKKKSNK